MVREESFDSFYRATRRRVLHQAFALTGDLPAAQSAVRDAYVGAWQHWRKVSRLDDPLDWVRPRAWQLAQRRHTARIWHRNKGVSEEHKAVLDALAKLPVAQRRVLLLTDLAGLDVAPAARELGVTRDAAELNQRQARVGLATALGVEPETSRERLVGLDDLLEHATLPRGPIVRRAGRKRRQGQALAGAVTAVAVALGAGAFTYQPTASNAEDLRLVKPETPAVQTDLSSTAPTGRNLLDHDQIRRLGPEPAVDGLRHRRQHRRRRHQHGLPAEPLRRPGRLRLDRAELRRRRSAAPLRGADRRGLQVPEAGRDGVRHDGRLVLRLPARPSPGAQRLPRRQHRRRGRRTDAADLEEAGHHPVRRGRPHRQGDHVDRGHDGRGEPAARDPDHPVAGGLGRHAVRPQRRRRTAPSGRPTASCPRRRPARNGASSPSRTCRRSAGSGSRGSARSRRPGA